MSFNDTSSPAPKVSTKEEIVIRWRETTKQQDQILSDVLTRNLELEALVKELEYNNWCLREQAKQYKAEFKAQDEKRNTLKKQIAVIESENDSFKNENSLIVCLLDGDGCVFEQEYLREGYSGGCRAAAELSSGILKYLRELPERIPAGAKVITMVFLSKAGLMSVLNRNDICTPEEFTAFLTGFGGAHQLFSIIDVGTGKEAADHKLREYLDMFTKMPQTYKVFFGGAHDNGYHGSLITLQTLGYKEKLVLVPSYTQTAREIGTLRLPTLSIPKLFMADKLDARPFLKKVHAYSEPILSHEFGQPLSPSSQRKRSGSQSKAAKKKNKAQAPAAKDPGTLGSNGSVHGVGVFAEEDEDEDKECQLLCMYQHLGDEGCQSMECPLDHDTVPSEEQLIQLKDIASITPCRFINENLPCTLKECHFGHECPRGPRCDSYGRNLCKFVGEGMHDE